MNESTMKAKSDGKSNPPVVVSFKHDLYVHPEPWGDDPITVIFFQMGWFNHHLETLLFGERVSLSQPNSPVKPSGKPEVKCQIWYMIYVIVPRGGNQIS